MNHRALLPVSVAAIAALLCVAAARPVLPPAARGPDLPADPPRDAVAAASPDPLDSAFRFATAIEADPKDQAMAQEDVVSELTALGRLEEAGLRAAEIKGWRQGTSYAD